MSRNVWVVGASSGIGRATAQQLARRGDRLVLSSRGKQALDDTAAECRELGAAEVVVAPVDVGDQAGVDDIVRSNAPFDAVVVTSGVVAYGRFEQVPAEVFDKVVTTNLIGVANVARAVLPRMRERKSGSLVLIGSVLGNIAAPSMTPYIVTKWAVRALGRQLAVENRDLPDVHVTVVSPGGVDTPIYQQAANYQGRAGRPPAPVDSANKVASAIVRSLDRPRDRISVGVLNPVMRLGFSALPRVFDAIVGPLFAVLASKPGTVAPTTGNVLEPVDDLEAVDAGEGQGLRDLAARLRGK
ncbi:MAG: short-chain dehydrogenase/reductase [Frankiales bacterium]|nr:short-chain dehydrogenase/reductase [Frankiales bacterium]